MTRTSAWNISAESGGAGRAEDEHGEGPARPGADQSNAQSRSVSEPGLASLR